MADDLVDQWMHYDDPAPSPSPAAAQLSAPTSESATGSGAEGTLTVRLPNTKIAPGAREPDDLVSQWLHYDDGAPPRNTTAPPPAAVASPVQPDKFGADLINDLKDAKSRGDTYHEHMVGATKTLHDMGATGNIALDYAQEGAANFLARHGYIDQKTADDIAQRNAARRASFAETNRQWEEAATGTAAPIGRVVGDVLFGGAALGGAGKLAEGALSAIPGAARVAAPIVGYAAAHPLQASMATGALTGAGGNLLTSGGYDTPALEQAGWGAVGGGAFGALGHGVGRVFGGSADRETADLADLAMTKYGIPVRADQISGNYMVRQAGGLAAKIPGSGLATNVVEQQGAFNRSLANEFGENADKITPYVMQSAKDRIGSEYDRTLPHLEGFLSQTRRGDGTADRLQKVADSTLDMTEEEGRLVMRRVNDIIRAYNGVSPIPGKPSIPHGVAKATGDEIQALIARGSPLDKAIKGTNSNIRDAASQLKEILLDSVSKTPTGRPKTAAAYVQYLNDFQKARYQWKALKTIEPLAADAPTGDISPARLASKLSDSDMLYGGGNLPELARIGQRFLKVPQSSGTAENALLLHLGGAGLGAIGGAIVDPEHVQRDALGGLALGVGTRGLGTVLRSGALARQAVRSGQNAAVPVLGPLLQRNLPLVAPNHNFLPAPFGHPALTAPSGP